MNAVPEFGIWYRWWLRDYKGKNIDDLITFAFRMASHTRLGEMYVRAPTLAQESGLTPSAVRSRRTRCADAGIIRWTGAIRNGERVYVRHIPKMAGVPSGDTSVPSGDTPCEVNSDILPGQDMFSVPSGDAIVRVELELERSVPSGDTRTASLDGLSGPSLSPAKRESDLASVPSGDTSVPSGRPLCARCGERHKAYEPCREPFCETCLYYHYLDEPHQPDDEAPVGAETNSTTPDFGPSDTCPKCGIARPSEYHSCTAA